MRGEIHYRQEEIDLLFKTHFPQRSDPEAPLSVESDNSGITEGDEALCSLIAGNEKQGAAFHALYSGDTSSHGSHSEADLALCNILAFWTGRDSSQIDRIFRSSGLYRPKWDKRHGVQTYGQITISKAIADCREAYKKSTPAPDGNNAKSEPVDAATLLRKFQVTKDYTDKLGKEKFLIDNLVISNHVATIIAMSGGGKTAFFFRHVAPTLAKEGLTVWYCDNDSPASEHKSMREAAEEHGFTFLNPDSVPGQSAETLLANLVQIAESGATIDDYVFIFDTLKKFCDMMGKKDIKKFYKLARKLTSLGATVILLGHANKYRSKEGHLVFEGTGDVKADSDELIYLESVKNSSGGIDVTTVCDTDKGAKVRGIFKPFSFNISPEREITFYDKALEMIDLSGTSTPKATDDEILAVAEQYLKDRGEPITQSELVNYARDMVDGTAGRDRVRKLIAQRSILKDNFTTKAEAQFGTKFVFSAGGRNKLMYDRLPEPPKQQHVFGEDDSLSTEGGMPTKNKLSGSGH